MVDHRAGTATAVCATGDEVPEPGTEVGSAENGVAEDADEQHDGGRRAHVGTSCGSRPVSDCVSGYGSGTLDGPYGTSSSP